MSHSAALRPFCPAGPARVVSLLLFASAFLAGVAASPASAVLSITGNANTSAPPGTADPGFASVGQRSSGGLTLIYLGNGWVLTANHVGEADLKLNSVVYPHIPGSGVRFLNEDGSPADLMAFQITGSPTLPELPILEIARVSPAVGTQVTMIGRGFSQDQPITWRQPGPPPVTREGWSWGTNGAIRWGTNRIADPADLMQNDTTDSFIIDFTKPGSPGVTTDESQAVVGDSGGAVFNETTGQWELAGVMFGRLPHPGQPEATSLDGNLTYSADLALFRSQIIPLVRPECSDEVDNDGDGKIDFPEDPGCHAETGQSEISELPSLGSPARVVLGATLIAASLLGTLGSGSSRSAGTAFEHCRGVRGSRRLPAARLRRRSTP